ncbi:MAG: D-alanyl-D-alanine carboxypeptidase, partial [Pseudomonadota bacterium]
GIKTGYTRAAGFNLVASAKRGNERVIATVFGGKSTSSRNARVAQLLDMGFARAPSRVAYRKPIKPNYTGNSSGRIVRAVTAVRKSLRPASRPVVESDIVVAVAAPAAIEHILQQTEDAPLAEGGVAASAAPSVATIRPKVRDMQITPVVLSVPPTVEPAQQIVAPGPVWAINVGKYATRRDAEKVLVRTALAEMATLNGAARSIQPRNQGYEAVFSGMTRDQADLACRKLQAQHMTCLMIAPAG